MANTVCEAQLCISVDVDGGRPSLRLAGKADTSNISGVVDVLDQLSDVHSHCLSLDLCDLESLDADAMPRLAASVGAYRNRGRRVHLKSVSPSVRQAFDRFQLSEMFCLKHCSCACNPDGCGHADKAWDMDVFTLPSNLANCREARNRVDKVAEMVGFSKCRRNDIKLAVGEAVTNAVNYGQCEDGESFFTVSCLATPEKLQVSISDNGPGFDPEIIHDMNANIFSEHGRGILCMNAFVDEVTFDFNLGVTVQMTKFAK